MSEVIKCPVCNIEMSTDNIPSVRLQEVTGFEKGMFPVWISCTVSIYYSCIKCSISLSKQFNKDYYPKEEGGE